MSNRKRIVAVLLAFLMIFEMLPVTAVAEGWAMLMSNVLQGQTYHSVTFQVDGETIASQYVEAGKNPVMPENPSKEEDRENNKAYVFAGWYDGDTQITAESVINSDVNAVAEFNTIGLYKVTVEYVIDTNGDGVNEPAADTVVRWYTSLDAAEYIKSPTNVLQGTLSDTYIPDQASVMIDPSTLTANTTFTVKYHTTDTTYTIYHQIHNPHYGEDPDVEMEYTLLGATQGHGLIGQTVSAGGLSAEEFETLFGRECHYNYVSSTSVVLTGDPAKDYVTVTYEPHLHVLTYDSQGGSYVAPVTKHCHEYVTVYSAIQGEDVLTCSLTEHTHEPYSGDPDDYNRGYESGCYVVRGYNNNRYWDLNCGLAEHTHSDSCYSAGADVSIPSTTRQGYIFGGWYLDAACTEAAPATLLLAENTTVYAKWIPGTANYTVVYWAEDIEGGYKYIESSVASGEVGSTVTAGSKSFSSSVFADQAYYHYDKADSAVVKANNTTVVNVYYALNTYTFRFDINKANTTMTINGQTYTNQNNSNNNRTYEYSFTAKYGEDVTSRWPTKAEFSSTTSGWTNNFYGWNPGHTDTSFVSKRYNVTEEMIADTDNGSVSSFVGIWQSGHDVTAYYMIQNTENDEYSEAVEYTQNLITDVNNFSAKQLDGVTNVSSMTKREQRTGGWNVYFYYTRNEYQIDYYYQSEKLDSKSGIRYGKNLSNTTFNWTPTAADAGLPSDYTFAGWYDNIDGNGEPYFNTKDEDGNVITRTMPAGNLVLYAKFNPPDRTITLMNADGTPVVDANGEDIIVTVTHGQVPEIPTPTREGYTFLGWYTAPDGGEAYDTLKPLTENVTIFAHWQLKTISLTIRYWTYGSTEDNYTEVLANRYWAHDALQPGEQYILHAQYAEGYRPTEATKPIVLTTGDNVATFYYVARDAVDYTVKYVLKSHPTEEIKDAKTVEAAIEVGRVSEIAPAIITYNGATYYPTVQTQSLVLTADESKNVIIFEYVPYKTATVMVRYWYPTADGTSYEINEAIKPSETISGVRIADSVYADTYKAKGEVSPYVFDSAMTKVVSVTVEAEDAGTELYLDLYYKFGYTSLTIEKVVKNARTDSAFADETEGLVFLFNVKDSAGNPVAAGVEVPANSTAMVDGLLIGETYTVTEVGVKGHGANALNAWTTEDAKTITLAESGNKVQFTNTRKIAGGNTGVTATKTWVGTAASSARLQLQRNGSAYLDAVSVTAPAWSYTWNNLPAYDLDGNAYTYTVKESGAANGQIKLDNFLYNVTEDGLSVKNAQVTDEITVSLKDKTVVYNGAEQSLDEAIITGGPTGLTLEDLNVQVTGGKGTNVGEYPAAITGDATYVDASGVVYTVTYIGAKLYITGMVVEHYLEQLDGTYKLAESATVGVLAGTYQDDDYDKTFEGFVYVSGAVDKVTAVTVEAGEAATVMKLYYVRDSFTVTYEYVGDVPADATELPAVQTYDYGATVNVAEDATAAGYVFSGWTTDDANVEGGKFTMPANDVVIKGSFTAGTNTPYTVEYYLQDTDANGNVLATYTLQENDTVHKVGTTGTPGVWEAKTYANYTYEKTESNNEQNGQHIILANGKLVIKVYYTRDVIHLTLGKDVVDVTTNDTDAIKFEINYTYEYDGKTITGKVELADDEKQTINLPKGGKLTVSENANTDVWTITGTGEYTLDASQAITVTNTRTLYDPDGPGGDDDLGKIRVEKHWHEEDGSELAEEFTPLDGVTVELWRGTTAGNATLFESAPLSRNTRVHTFENLVATDLNGNDYVYVVKEAGAKNGEVVHLGYHYNVSGIGMSDSGVAQDGYIILVNTLKRTDVVVTKKWVLNGIQLIFKPDLQMTLTAGGKTYGILAKADNTVTATSEDTYTFKNVPYRTDYVVVEELTGHGKALLNGKETNIHGTFEGTQSVAVGDDLKAEVVNTAKYAAITVQKTVNLNGLNVTIPEFTFNIEVNGETETVTLQPTEDQLTVSKQVLIDIPTSDVVVTETAVDGWTASAASVTLSQSAIVGKNDKVVAEFTNTRQKLPLADGTTVEITKTITDYSADTMAGELFDFVVTVPADLKNGSDVTYQIGDSTPVTVKANGSFLIKGVKHGETVKVTSGLPTGTYNVREEQDELNHHLYEATVTKTGDYSFTATNKPVTGDLILEKRWEHPNGEVDSAFAYGADGKAVTTFGLFTNPEATEAYMEDGKAVVVTTNANGDAIFEHINPGTYYIKELSVSNADNYAVSSKILTVVVEANATIPAAYTFVNELKHTTKDEGAILIEKIVDNVKNENVSFTITYTYTLTDESGARALEGGTITATVDANGNVVYTGDPRELVDLPYGTIVTVKETFDGHEGEAWTTTINGVTTRTTTVMAGAQNQTVTVTNSRKLRDNNGVLTVYKEWIDNNNADKLRPVLADYVSLYSHVHEGQWTASTYGVEAVNADQTVITYSELPAYNLDGKLLTYGVKEDAMAPYVADHTGYVLDGGKIVNTLYTDLTITKIWNDVDNDAIKGGRDVQVNVLRDGEIVATEYVMLDTLKATVRVPKYDAKGNAYVYDIKEIGEDKGEMMIGELRYTVKYDKSGGYAFTVTNTKEQVKKNAVSEAGMTVQVEKDGQIIDMVKVGGKITYTITFGNYTSEPANVTLTDTLPAGLTFVKAESTQGATVNGQTVTWSMDNMPARTHGTVTIVAVVNENAIKNAGNPVIQNIATITVGDVQEKTTPATEIVYNPAWTVDKIITNEGNGAFKVGDTIRYEITVVNTGNVDLTLKAVDTFKVDGEIKTLNLTSEGTDNPASFELKVGEKAVFTATYEVQADDKEIVNAVVVEDGDDETDDPSDEVTTKVETNNAWTVSKSVNKTTAQVGDVVEYTITVTNTGNVDLEGMSLTDTLTVDSVPGELELSHATADAADFDLAKHASITFTAEYTVKATDNLITNIAVSKHGDTTEPSNEVTTEVEDAPAWTTDKKVVSEDEDKDGKYAPGETIQYEITVTNTGNTTLEGLKVTDVLTVDGEAAELTVGLADKNGTHNPEAFTLTESETVTFTASYTVKATDNKVTNVAIASKGDDEDPSDPVDTDVEDAPAWTVDKEADKETYKVGETVTYTITVKNTGNTTLNLKLEDTFTVGGDEVELTLTNDAGLKAEGFELEEGDEAVFTATYEVKDDDTLLVNAVVTSDDDPDTEDKGDEEESKVEPNPLWTVEKTADKTSVKVGETVTYTITVKNTGNVDLPKLTIVDTFTVDGEKVALTLTNAARLNPADFALAKGATAIFTASYTVEQDDSVLTNAVVVKDDDSTTPDPEDEVITIVDDNPVWTVQKEITNKGTGAEGAFKVGDVVEYTITVVNTGNVDLTKLTLSDLIEIDGKDPVELAVPAEAKEFDLAKGATKTFVITYTVQPTDKTLVNTAIVSGEDGEEEDTTDPEEIEDNPTWTVQKEITNKGTGEDGAFKVGDDVEYTITVTNTGNVDLTKLILSDLIEIDGKDPVEMAAPAEAKEFDLAKGATKTFVITYTVKPTDKTLVNTAIVSGEDGEEEDTTDPEEIEDNPTWTVQKEITNKGTGAEGAFKVGDVVEYTITVTNTGNVDLTKLTLSDLIEIDSKDPVELAAPAEAKEFDLAKGATKTFVITYTVQPTDNTLVNTAIVKGEDGEEEDTTDPEEIEENPDWTVTKTVANKGTDKDGAFKVGDTVIYKIVVTNTGNTDLEDLKVTDKFFVDGMATDVALKPNKASIDLKEGESVEFTAEYTIKATDKQLVNSVTVTGDEDEREDEVIVDVEPNEAVIVTKEVINNGSGEGYRFMVGDKIRYRVTVTNVGNVELKDLTLVDTFKVNGWTKELKLPAEAAKFDLAKGETVVFNYSYLIGEDDARLVNVATVLDSSDKVTTDVTDIPAVSAEIPPAVGYTYNVGDCFD